MANNLEMRKVIVRYPNPYTGGEAWVETWEYRTKDIVSAILGLVPISSTWSAWTRIETVTVDQNGDPMP